MIKFHGNNDDSDDGDNLMKPALFIKHRSDFDPNFDAKVAPTSGEEYLHRVMVEAANCDTIVISKIDHKKIKKQSVGYKMPPSCSPAPTGFAHPLDWQLDQVANFSKLRVRMARIKALREEKGRVSWRNAQHLPAREDDVGWWRFCFGSKYDDTFLMALSESPDSRPVNSPQISDEECGGKKPTLDILLLMIQPVIEDVLQHHVVWLQGTGFTAHQGLWFYALLTFLEKPLSPNACSVLRSLARTCSTMRSQLDSPDHPHLTPLNLLICLIARYFDQTDLADSFP